MPKLVIFDLDGTLINSVADLAVCTNYALEKFGFPSHTENEYRFFVGNGVNVLFEKALPQGYKTEEWIQKMREVMLPYYAEHCTDKTAPYKGIYPLIEKIKNNGIMLAVASNKYQAATTEMVRHFFPNINFVAVLGQIDGFPAKPHPQIVERIMQIANVQHSDTLYVGDTAVDIQTAKNAGVKVVGVTWGFRPRTELEAEYPDFIIDSVEELDKIIFE